MSDASATASPSAESPPSDGELAPFQLLQFQFAAHLRDPARNVAPAGLEDRRLQIYRDLFYNNVASLLASNFPVLRRILRDEQWHALARDFFASHRAHTPLFPEIGREFLRFLEARSEVITGDLPFLGELAHYEWAELAVSIDDSEIESIPHDADGDVVGGVPVASPVAWPLVYRFPVHRIREDYLPEFAPAQPTCLIVARNRADDVSFMETTPVIVRLLEHVKESTGRTGLEHVHAVAAELGAAGNPEVIAAGCDMLRQLRVRDVLLGTRIAA